jgi:hypothetical protein
VTAPGSKNTQLGNRFVGLMVGKTSAKKKRQAYVNYQEIVEKDVNSFERDSEIQYCTYKKCMADYGNEDCSTELSKCDIGRKSARRFHGVAPTVTQHTG